jgi:hypothetical protein
MEMAFDAEFIETGERKAVATVPIGARFYHVIGRVAVLEIQMMKSISTPYDGCEFTYHFVVKRRSKSCSHGHGS